MLHLYRCNNAKRRGTIVETTHKTLENHVIYGLDRAICDYLTPILEQKLGEPFRVWRFLLQEQSTRSADATRTLGRTLVGQAVEFQEELLGYGGGEPQLNQAWHRLMGTYAGVKWRELCMLYSCADAERRDLENMAEAQQAAEDGGDAAHIRRVREIMALEDILSPSWWSGK